MNQLDPSVKNIWRINIIMRYVFYSLAFLVVEWLLISPNIVWNVPFGLISALLFAFGLTWTVIIPIYRYKYWRFAIEDNEIRIKYGVFTRVTTTAPFVRIQHIDVQQSILDRMHGLAKLIIYTAGSRGADILIPGLPLEYAEDMRDSLKDLISTEEF
jgi:membrane protein YdbS with pleckstrin-like domain